MSDKKAVTNESVKLAQAEYTGESQQDTVEVKIIKANAYYKVDDTDNVHPTVAMIMQEKGLIDDSWKKKVKTYVKPTKED